jgi:hypothetical protein
MMAWVKCKASIVFHKSFSFPLKLHKLMLISNTLKKKSLLDHQAAAAAALQYITGQTH